MDSLADRAATCQYHVGASGLPRRYYAAQSFWNAGVN